MANEKIEVGYRHIDTFANVDYHHKFLIYTDKTGRNIPSADGEVKKLHLNFL